MLNKRVSGILLPIASLPAKDIGNFGSTAFDFINKLVKTGQKIWQVLPIGPTITNDSPFYSPSAFAINPNYIDLYDLDGLLTQEDIDEYYHKFDHEDPNKINYELLWNEKKPLLEKASNNFMENNGSQNESFVKFVGQNSVWLEDYAYFMGIKEIYMEHPDKKCWYHWDDEFKYVEAFSQSLQEYFQILENKENIGKFQHWNEQKLETYHKIIQKSNFHKFTQWVAFQQWYKLKHFANEKNIIIIGDCPIYVAPDSADVWANRAVFKLDNYGLQTCYAGVPPDYFSPKYGQFWGNPIYKWFIGESNQDFNPETFKWWTNRLKYQLNLFDELRIDHFRGFAAYWEVPADRCDVFDGNGNHLRDEYDEPLKTSQFGSWEKGPGLALFEYVASQLGTTPQNLPLIAEDLGVITEDVEYLRDSLQAPGMGVFQFAPWKNLHYKIPGQNPIFIENIDHLNSIPLNTNEEWGRLLYRRDGQFVKFLDHEFLPHNAKRLQKLVFYPGTHDNDTLHGWYNDYERIDFERTMFLKFIDRVLDYNFPHEPLHWKVIRVLWYSSQPTYVIAPMQDILGLEKERLNIPNKRGQWKWKLGGYQQFSGEVMEKLFRITQESQRI